jgi:hypothetical protein
MPLKLDRRFRGTCHLYLQCWRVSQGSNQHKAGNNLWWFLLALLFNSEDAGNMLLRNIGCFQQITVHSIRFQVESALLEPHPTLIKMCSFHLACDLPESRRQLIFWDLTPCNLVEAHRCFGGTYYLPLQDRSQARYQQEVYGKHAPPKHLWTTRRHVPESSHNCEYFKTNIPESFICWIRVRYRNDFVILSFQVLLLSYLLFLVLFLQFLTIFYFPLFVILPVFSSVQLAPSSSLRFLRILKSTSNYSAVGNLHTLQISTASAKPFSSLMCLHKPFPGNGFNSGDSSVSRAQVLASQRPVQNSTLNRQLTTLPKYSQAGGIFTPTP